MAVFRLMKTQTELLYSVTGALMEHKHWECFQKEVKDPH